MPLLHNRRASEIRSLLIIATLVVSGCANDTQRGILEGWEGEAQVVAPQQASVAVPFVVHVTTYAYCASFASTEVTTHDDEAMIEPYDTVRSDGPCPKVILHIQHDASIVFESSGTKTIWVRGLDERDALLTLPYSVSVN